MKKHIVFALCTISLVAGCGGGSSASPAIIDTPAVNIVTTNLATQIVRGASCESYNNDIANVAKFGLFQLNNRQVYHCLEVHKSDGHPTKSGDYAYRFELHPEDCTWSSDWNDCLNDRSRTEIEDDTDGINIYNKEIVWDYWMYIPAQPKFRPAGSVNLFVSQLLTMSTNKLNYFGLTQMLISNENKLVVRPLKQFSFISEGDIPVVDNPYNQWINIRYEVKTSMNSDGYIRMMVNGNTVVNKTGQNVLDNNLRVMLRLGIYNGLKSNATEPYSTQVIYYDSVTKSIK
jgi:Polysaccharide lyase